MASSCQPSQDDNALTTPHTALGDGEQHPDNNCETGSQSTNGTPNREGGDPGTPRSRTITPTPLAQSPPRVRPQGPHWPEGYIRCFESALDGQVEHLFRARWRPSTGAFGVPQADEQVEQLVALLVTACRNTQNVLDDELHGSYFAPGGMWRQDPKDIEAICWNLVQKIISIHVDGAYGLQWNRENPSSQNGNSQLTFQQRMFVVKLLLEHYKRVAHSLMLQQNVEETLVMCLTCLFVDNRFRESLGGMHELYRDTVAAQFRGMDMPSAPKSESIARVWNEGFPDGQLSRESTPCKRKYESQGNQDSPSTPQRRTQWSLEDFSRQTPPTGQESEPNKRYKEFQGGSQESTPRQGSYEVQGSQGSLSTPQRRAQFSTEGTNPQTPPTRRGLEQSNMHDKIHGGHMSQETTPRQASYESQGIQDSPSNPQRRTERAPNDISPQMSPMAGDLEPSNMHDEVQGGHVSQGTTSRKGSNESQGSQDAPSISQLRSQESPEEVNPQMPPMAGNLEPGNMHDESQDGYVSEDTSSNKENHEFQGSQNAPSIPQRRAQGSPEDTNTQPLQTTEEAQPDDNVPCPEDVDWDTWLDFGGDE